MLRDFSLFLDTRGALQKSGELLDPLLRRLFAADDLRSTLTDLCRGAVAGRHSSDDFKSAGTALEGLESAPLVCEGALFRRWGDQPAKIRPKRGPKS